MKAAERLTTRRPLRRNPSEPGKATVATQASPYELGLRFVLTPQGVNSQPAPRGQFSTGLDSGIHAPEGNYHPPSGVSADASRPLRDHRLWRRPVTRVATAAGRLPVALIAGVIGQLDLQARSTSRLLAAKHATGTDDLVLRSLPRAAPRPRHQEACDGPHPTSHPGSQARLSAAARRLPTDSRPSLD